MFGGAQSEAAAGGEVVAARLFRQEADHRGEPCMAERFFERPQNVLGLCGAHFDQLIRVEPGRSEAERIDPAFAERLVRRISPDKRAGPRADDAGGGGEGEAERGGEIARSGGKELVHRPGLKHRQATREAERRGRTRGRDVALARGDVLAQRLKNRFAVHRDTQQRPGGPQKGLPGFPPGAAGKGVFHVLR